MVPLDTIFNDKNIDIQEYWRRQNKLQLIPLFPFSKKIFTWEKKWYQVGPYWEIYLNKTDVFNQIFFDIKQKLPDVTNFLSKNWWIIIYGPSVYEKLNWLLHSQWKSAYRHKNIQKLCCKMISFWANFKLLLLTEIYILDQNYNRGPCQTVSNSDLDFWVRNFREIANHSIAYKSVATIKHAPIIRNKVSRSSSDSRTRSASRSHLVPLNAPSFGW